MVVKLYQDEQLLSEKTTGDDGKYKFENLQPGSYMVRFYAPAGYSFSPKDQGSDDTKDSDAWEHAVTLSEETTMDDDTVDAGVVTNASIGDWVWMDADENGIQDEGEEGAGGVTVKLKQGGTVVATTETASDGSYLFDNLAAGTYTVLFVLPEELKFTVANAGGNDDKDSDGPESAPVTLAVGQFVRHVDAGVICEDHETPQGPIVYDSGWIKIMEPRTIIQPLADSQDGWDSSIDGDDHVADIRYQVIAEDTKPVRVKVTLRPGADLDYYGGNMELLMNNNGYGSPNGVIDATDWTAEERGELRDHPNFQIPTEAEIADGDKRAFMRWHDFAAGFANINIDGETSIEHNLNPTRKTTGTKGTNGPGNSSRSAVWSYDAGTKEISWTFSLGHEADDMPSVGSVDVVVWYSDSFDYPQQKQYYNVPPESPTVMRPVPIIPHGIKLKWKNNCGFEIDKSGDIAPSWGAGAEKMGEIDFFGLVESVTGDVMKW